MTSDVRMLVGSDFYLGVKERPPGLAPLMRSFFWVPGFYEPLHTS